MIYYNEDSILNKNNLELRNDVNINNNFNNNVTNLELEL